MFWLDRMNTQPVAPTLEQFARESGMPELLKEGDALKALLFARPAETGPIELQRKWSGEAFLQSRGPGKKERKFGEARGRKRSKQKMLCLNPEEGSSGK